jgi:transcriptional regulator with XRE-family HTH domain
VKRLRIILPHRPWCRREVTIACIAKTVRTLRQRTGVSQETLAWSADVDRNYLGKVERRKLSPTIVTLDRVLTILDVSWAQFGAALDAELAADSGRVQRRP